MRLQEGDLVHVTLPGQQPRHGVVITDEQGGASHVAVHDPDGTVTLLGLVGTAFLAPRPTGQPQAPASAPPPPGGPA